MRFESLQFLQPVQKTAYRRTSACSRRRCASSEIAAISCAIMCCRRSRSWIGGAADAQALGGPYAILLGLGSGGLAWRDCVPGRAPHARRCPINHLPHHPAPRPPTTAPRGQTTSLLLRLPSENCVPPNMRIQPTPFRRARSPLFRVLYLF